MESVVVMGRLWYKGKYGTGILALIIFFLFYLCTVSYNNFSHLFVVQLILFFIHIIIIYYYKILPVVLY